MRSNARATPETVTLTYALTGDVTLDDLVQAVSALKKLLAAIKSEQQIKSPIEWIVDDLEGGSALVRLAGMGEREPLRDVAKTYQLVGRDASRGRLPNSPSMRDAIYKLTDYVGNGNVTSARFETQEDDATVTQSLKETKKIGDPSGRSTPPHGREIDPVPGSVRGRIQSMSNRKSLQFTMYDLGSDRAVSCYLEPGSEALMRKAWGRIATVSGMIRRNPLTGDPATVRNIRPESIQLIPEISGSWRDAIGVLKSKKNSPRSETIIRRMRDG